ncbi:MAG: hypothetical protein PVH43_07185 [Desulfobacterales bacterium]|jgi:hypothetical protein
MIYSVGQLIWMYSDLNLMTLNPQSGIRLERLFQLRGRLYRICGRSVTEKAVLGASASVYSRIDCHVRCTVMCAQKIMPLNSTPKKGIKMIQIEEGQILFKTTDFKFVRTKDNVITIRLYEVLAGEESSKFYVH